MSADTEPDRVIDGKPYWWQGHYLVDEKNICPHGVHVEYRCDGCDEDYGWQGKDPAERRAALGDGDIVRNEWLTQDVVVRLRHAAKTVMEAAAEYTLTQAADEIERLRRAAVVETPA